MWVSVFLTLLLNLLIIASAVDVCLAKKAFKFRGLKSIWAHWVWAVYCTIKIVRWTARDHSMCFYFDPMQRHLSCHRRVLIRRLICYLSLFQRSAARRFEWTRSKLRSDSDSKWGDEMLWLCMTGMAHIYECIQYDAIGCCCRRTSIVHAWRTIAGHLRPRGNWRCMNLQVIWTRTTGDETNLTQLCE